MIAPGSGRAGLHRQLRGNLRRFGAAPEPHAVDLDRMEAEIAFLREENARLRYAEAQTPDPGRLIERLRARFSSDLVNGDIGHANERDEVWQALTDVMLVRNVLIDLCAELGQVTMTLQGRLDSVTSLARAAPPEAAGGLRRRV